MKIKNLVFYLVALSMLNGCVQSTALVGPAITGVSSGSIYQAGISYGSSYLIEKETGMTIIQLASDTATKQSKKKEKRNDFIVLVEKQIQKTRKKLYPDIN